MLVALLLVMLSKPSFATPTPCERARALAEEAATIRKLDARRAIPCQTLPDTEYIKYANALSESANSAEDLKREEDLFKLLGLIPADYRYAECMLRGAGDSSYALFDRSADTIILRESSLDEAFILHEIVHALQHQHFDLVKLNKRVNSTDSGLAISALTEGDAIVRELSFSTLGSQEITTDSNDGYDKYCSPPDALREILLFSYTWGQRFVEVIESLGSLSDLDRSFRSPPLTSSDIMHPRRYFDQGRMKTRLPDLQNRAGFNSVYEDTLGEFVLLKFLRMFATLPEAARAVRGWRGDKIALLQSEGGEDLALTWRIELENPESAGTLLALLRGYTEKRLGISIDKRALNWEARRGVSIAVESEKDSVTLHVTSSISNVKFFEGD